MIAAGRPPADPTPPSPMPSPEGPWQTFATLREQAIERFPEHAATLILFLDRVGSALDRRASQPPPPPGSPPPSDDVEASLVHLEEYLEALLAQDRPRGGP